MSSIDAQVIEPTVQIDSVAIGLQKDSDTKNAINLSILDMTEDEYLFIGEKTHTAEPSHTIYNFIVNKRGITIDASRDTTNNLATNTSLYTGNNIVCDGAIIAKSLHLENITISSDDPVTATMVSNIINISSVLANSQPFKTGFVTKDIPDISNEIFENVENVYSTKYLTLGVKDSTYKNTHPLNIVSYANNNFDSMQIAIRNEVNIDDGPSTMNIGIIGGNTKSPAIISTSIGMPLEFHVSQSSNVINNLYGDVSLPVYDIEIGNLPAMTIDENRNVGIGINKNSEIIFNRYNNTSGNIISINQETEKPRLEVIGISKFDEIVSKDFMTDTYKNIDDIYIRKDGFGSLNASQIGDGNFQGKKYIFNSNIEIKHSLTTSNITVSYDAIIEDCLTSTKLIIKEESLFRGEATFNTNVIFNGTDTVNIKNLNVENFYIDDVLVSMTNINEVSGSTVNNDFGMILTNNNVSFPKKIGIGFDNTDGFNGMFNIIKNDLLFNDTFDIFMKSTIEAIDYETNIGRLHRLDYTDNSLIINTNKVQGKKNNIYFYPSFDISQLTDNANFPNLKNTPPTLSINESKVAINKLIPDEGYALDVNGDVKASHYYLNINNDNVRTNNFIYEEQKNYFNLIDVSTNKFCVNYNSVNSISTGMKGFNVKEGLNADLYYQNDKLIETLKIAKNNTDTFYTQKKIAIGWTNENIVAPLQVRNITTEDNNYSVVRIYRGVRGGGANNNADYSGIDICEFDRSLDNERNNEKWFIYKNHMHNNVNNNDIPVIGPLQIGYTDKTFKPTSYGMSFYYNTVDSNYHIDVNNPNVDVISQHTSAMSIYGDLEVHGNIKIIDANGDDFNFKLNTISNLANVINNATTYSTTQQSSSGDNSENNIIALNFSLLTPDTSIIIHPITSDNMSIPLIVKQVDNDFSVAKFITYEIPNEEQTSSSIELGIYHVNNSVFEDNIDKLTNTSNMVELKIMKNDNNASKFNMSFYDIKTKSYNEFINFKSNNDDNGSIINTQAHFGLGNNINNSNVGLHIDSDDKYGLQITNNNKPASINLVNTGGDTNIIHTIYGGNHENNYKFSINASSGSLYNESLSESNVFTIDAFDSQGNNRNGSRFGFNDTNPTESFVIKSEYNTASLSVYNRYTSEYLSDSIVSINLENIVITQPETTWINLDYKYVSDYNYQINVTNNFDNFLNIITTEDKNDPDFIFKTKITSTKQLVYETNYTNIPITYYSSNISIDYIDYNYNSYLDNYDTIINEDSISINQIFNSGDNYNIKIFPELSYDINTIISENLSESTHSINFDTIKVLILQRTLEDSSIENYSINYDFNFSYLNKYLIQDNLTCNITILPGLIIDNIVENNSNIITINNIIYTDIYKYEEIEPLVFVDNGSIYSIDNINTNTIKLEDSEDNTNIYMNTNTHNIIRYNSNISITDNFSISRQNVITFETNNELPNNFINANYDNELEILEVLIPIVDTNNPNIYNINISTSNYSIDTTINNIDRNMKLLKIEYNSQQDTIKNIVSNFDIYGNSFTNNIALEEYYNFFDISETREFIIQIQNYNVQKIKPHITLLNKKDYISDDINGYEIYAYDGIFELKYIDNSKSINSTNLKIDNLGDMFIKGIINAESDIIITGKLYDKDGNDLVEILNQGLYNNYFVTSSNVLFNNTGEKGVEISSKSSLNFDNYNLLYVNDKIDGEDIKDVMVLHKNNLNTPKYKIDLYGDIDTSNGILRVEGRDVMNDTSNYISRTSNVISTTLNTKISNTSNYIYLTSNILYDNSSNLDYDTSNYILRTSNVISTTLNTKINDSSNYILQTSNIISNTINNINADYVENGDNNRFIVNDTYDRDINVTGKITARDLEITGESTIFRTDVYVTEQLEVLNTDVNTAFILKQDNLLGDIINISNNTNEVFTIINNGNIGIGTTDPSSILSIYGDNSILKIQDGRSTNNSYTAIELINGNNNNIEKNGECGWRISNTNNKYKLESGNNDIITERFVINGLTGNIGVNINEPNHELDVNGGVNATSYNINGIPFVLEFSQGMTIQTKHNTYTSTNSKTGNSNDWEPINNDILNGFVINIKPCHISSKILVSIVCHIGMDYEYDSRWWGLQLYRKIGTGNWVKLTGANGNDSDIEGSECWISHNLGAESSAYSHFIANVTGSYEDMPYTTDEVYYTAYWKSKLNDNIGHLYLNKSATQYEEYYPKPSSSWTATEIWNNGTPFTPINATIAIAHDKVGMGKTPLPDSSYKLDVVGTINCTSITQTSDIRYKKNIEKIDSVIDLVNRINPVSYLLLDQNELTDKKNYGFIAQEIETIFPNVVNRPSNNNDNYSIDYSSIIPLLTKSIQELTEKINNQQKEINELKTKFH